MNKTVLVFILTALFAFISNPKRREHQFEVKESLLQSSNQIPETMGEAVGKGLGLILGKSVLGFFLDNASYNNYWLFSTLTVTKGQKTRWLSIGILGQVIVIEDLKELLTE